MEDPRCSIPARIFEHPRVQTESDWMEFKQRFQLNTTGRFPNDWADWTEHSRRARHPIVLRLLGSFSALTNVIGQDEPTGLFMSLTDRPRLVRQIIEHFVDLNIVVAEKALSEANVDVVFMGDQIAGDDGPLISPKTMQDFFIEGYRRIVEFLRSHGVKLILYNADGNVLPFVDMLVEIGIDGFVGVPAKMDMPGLKSRYGDAICMIGGIDRWILLNSPEAIELEVREKVALAGKGRIIPCLSGQVLPETRLANYKHYASCLRKYLWAADLVHK